VRGNSENARKSEEKEGRTAPKTPNQHEHTSARTQCSLALLVVNVSNIFRDNNTPENKQQERAS
jgi:hypothetical protein